MARSAQGASIDGALRPPQQNRSRASLDRVLEAGKELLVEKGFDGFTVQEVSKRAKVSIGSIYARAPNKDTLVFAVYDHAVAELRDERQAFDDPTRWEGLSFDELVHAALREAAETMLRHEAVLKVIMTRAAIDLRVRERGAAQVYDVARQWEELILTRRGEIAHADPDLAVEIAFRMFYAALVRRISFGPDFGAYRKIDDDETLIQEMGAAATAYLTTPSAAAAMRKRAVRKRPRRRAKAA
ncbi:MAG TPA: TetR/AcrR family transcriptional regulator [Baekduia sp.]|nr:TetR/AcrR family transcriptional regulator [Baekduia sp.]